MHVKRKTIIVMTVLLSMIGGGLATWEGMGPSTVDGMDPPSASLSGYDGGDDASTPADLPGPDDAQRAGIGSREAVSRDGTFAFQDSLPVDSNAFVVGDVDNDGLNELFIQSSLDLYIYEYTAGEYEEVWHV